MRILHVSDFYLPRLGGIELHVSDLSRRQRVAGHEVSVLTSSPGPGEEWVTRLGASGRWQHALHPTSTRRGLAALVAADVDVVHAHIGVASPLGFFLARAAARRGIPTVVTVHSMWVGVRPIMSALDAWGRWSRLPIVWTAVSEAAAQRVRRVLGQGCEVSVIPNGIDQGDWRESGRAGALRQEAGPVVVAAAVMRLSGRKRPFALLRAVRRAQKHVGSDSRIHLLVAGDGPMRRPLEGYIRAHGMSADVTFLGRLDRAEVRTLLDRADVFVAPATRESFGIAALEARCAGLPVLAMSSGGVREFVRHDVEGLLCDDDGQLAGALARIVDDQALRHRIRQHNLAVDTPVAWSGVLALTEEAYAAAGAVPHGSPQPTEAA
ncbi:MAG: glycosyltransferase family 4 protein [Nostocoides sp.]